MDRHIEQASKARSRTVNLNGRALPDRGASPVRIEADTKRDATSVRDRAASRVTSKRKSVDQSDRLAGPLLHAAAGDDDLMSMPPQPSRANADELRTNWNQRISSAQLAWGKLTEDELLRSQGQERKLMALVQHRYSITPEQAKKQVRSFLDRDSC